MKSQVLTLEHILLFSLILFVIAATYTWSIPVVDEIIKNAEINRVENSFAGLDTVIREVSHQPGAIREFEIDLGSGYLSVEPPIIVYTITLRKSEASPRVSGPSPIRLFIDEYEYTVRGGKLAIGGEELRPGDLFRTPHGFVQLEDMGPTFALLSGKALPARKDTKAGEDYRIELYLYYGFGLEGGGSRTGRTLIRIKNEEGVVRVEF